MLSCEERYSDRPYHESLQWVLVVQKVLTTTLVDVCVSFIVLRIGKELRLREVLSNHKSSPVLKLDASYLSTRDQSPRNLEWP